MDPGLARVGHHVLLRLARERSNSPDVRSGGGDFSGGRPCAGFLSRRCFTDSSVFGSVVVPRPAFLPGPVAESRTAETYACDGGPETKSL